MRLASALKDGQLDEAKVRARSVLSTVPGHHRRLDVFKGPRLVSGAAGRVIPLRDG